MADPRAALIEETRPLVPGTRDRHEYLQELCQAENPLIFTDYWEVFIFG